MIGEIIGLLAGGGLFAAKGVTNSIRNVDDKLARDKAKENGMPYFRDRIGRLRSVYTGNPTERRMMPGGRIYLHDAKTGMFLCDMTLLQEKEENERLIKEGKRFIIKKFPNFGKHLDHNGFLVTIEKRVEIETGLPYEFNAFQGRYWLTYLDPEGKGGYLEGKPYKYITLEEVKYYT